MHNIPKEILMKIFSNINHVDDDFSIEMMEECNKSLNECRAVCRKWKLVADTILFERPILTSIKQLEKFKEDFKARQDEGLFVKQLQVPIYQIVFDKKSLKLLKELIDMVFTPMLRSFKGILEGHDIYEMLLEKVKNSKLSFKLKDIPYCFSPCSAYTELALELKDTLEQVFVLLEENVDNSHLIEQSGNFKRLQKILLSGVVSGLSDLNTLLNKHSTLKSLTFTDFSFDFDDFETTLKRQNPMNGLCNKETSSLDLLTISYCRKANLCLQYALEKFKTIHKANVTMMDPEYSLDYDTLLKENISVLDILEKSIPEYNFNFENSLEYPNIEKDLLAHLGLDKNSVKRDEQYTTITVKKTS
ncbi:hypothetical protein [Parasitella parasitica]|uniref:F-box domain-containing protein n=1 Tax=Parasitella parasitica TaxID=35722 RepID=A0A0B7NBR5_9FUNG|nr:hypothetical protein [Parasitella parasitica]